MPSVLSPSTDLHNARSLTPQSDRLCLVTQSVSIKIIQRWLRLRLALEVNLPQASLALSHPSKGPLLMGIAPLNAALSVGEPASRLGQSQPLGTLSHHLPVTHTLMSNLPDWTGDEAPRPWARPLRFNIPLAVHLAACTPAALIGVWMNTDASYWCSRSFFVWLCLCMFVTTRIHWVSIKSWTYLMDIPQVWPTRVLRLIDVS